MQGDADAVPRTLDNNLGEGCELKASTQIPADPEIFMKLGAIVIALGVPLGAPVTIDNESESDGIYFLSHIVFCWRRLVSLFARLPDPLRSQKLILRHLLPLIPHREIAQNPLQRDPLIPRLSDLWQLV